VHKVPSLVNRLAENEEIVFVGSKEQRADLTVTITVPNVVSGVNRDVSLFKHELKGHESVDLFTVDICVAIFDHMGNFCLLTVIVFCGCCFNDLLNDSFMDDFRDQDQWRSRIENGIGQL